MEMTKNFSTNLRILRKAYGYTQGELASLINTSRSCISNYESGHRLPDSTTLVLIADVFNVSTDYILGRSPIKHLLQDENTLALIYDCINRAENSSSLNIRGSSIDVKCAVMDFYNYLLSKENTVK